MNDPNFPWQNYRADYRTKYRQNFPALADKSYFNYGGQGPMSRQALEAIYQAYEYLQTKGPFSGQVGMWIKEQTGDRPRNQWAGGQYYLDRGCHRRLQYSDVGFALASGRSPLNF